MQLLVYFLNKISIRTHGLIFNGMVFLIYLFSFSVLANDSNNVILGSHKDDELHGTTFADEIYGGKGDDIIYGGFGADVLFGGAGADEFVVQASELDSVDTIKDFNPDEGDTIVLQFNSPSIKNMRIPKELGTSNIKLDKNGNLKILMDSKDWMTLMNIEHTNMYFQVENESNFIRFVFDKKF